MDIIKHKINSIPLDMSKIERREVRLGNLEIFLEERTDFGWYVILKLEGHGEAILDTFGITRI